MAIAEQFLIDPGTEMIPTPPIHLPGFDLDQFAMHHDILIGYSTRLKMLVFDPAPGPQQNCPTVPTAYWGTSGQASKLVKDDGTGDGHIERTTHSHHRDLDDLIEERPDFVRQPRVLVT